MPTDRPNTIPWPPIIYLAGGVVGLAIGTVAPLPWVTSPLDIALQILGVLGAIAAVVLDIVTVQTFRRHQTTVLPHRGATHLITTGPFAWSRNPIYVGNTLLVIAAGLFFGKPWLIIFALIAAYATQKLAVEREERHLQSMFGEAWQNYAARVRRWI